MKILVDASNAWYRAYVATMLDKPGGPVLIMTYMLRRLCNEYGKNNIILCWDAGKGGRKELDENYKAGRKAVDGVWEDIAYMKQMVTSLGLANAQADGFEADDVVGSLAKQMIEPVRIVSYDKDFYQLVEEKIEVLRPERTVKGQKIPQQVISRDEVIEEFGCPPEKVILCKSFKGDASDNIPKISIRFTKGFLEQFFKAVLKSDTVTDFYNNLDCFDTKYHQELLTFKDRAILNEKIVKIKTDLSVEVKSPKMDITSFEQLCKDLNINKLKASDWQTMATEAPPPAPIQNSLF